MDIIVGSPYLLFNRIENGPGCTSNEDSSPLRSSVKATQVPSSSDVLAQNNRGCLNSWQQKQLQKFLTEPFQICDKTKTINITITLEGFLKRLSGLLHQQQVEVHAEGIRLVGGCASMILSLEEGDEARLDHKINDVDIDFYVGVNLPFFQILQCEEDCLASFVQEQTGQHLNLRTVCDNFFMEMIRVNTEEESWSLITVGNGKMHLDIRFIERTKRSYAFSTDSFSVILNPLLSSHCLAESIVPFESDYGDAQEAMLHLRERKLKTKHPEQVRRGIFRICLELSKGRFFETAEEEQEIRSAFSKSFIKEFDNPDTFMMMLAKFLMKHPANDVAFLNHLLQFITKSQHPKVFALLRIVLTFLQQRERTYRSLFHSLAN